MVRIPKTRVSPVMTNDQQPLSTYDEVYLSLGKLKTVLHLLGLFPIVAEVKSEGHGLRLQLHSTSLILSILSLIGCCLYFYFLIWHYVIFVPNYLESVIRTLIIVFFASFAILNLFSLVVNADQWASYFRCFQTIDGLLDLRHDAVLRSHVQLCTIVAAILFSAQIGSSVLALIIRQFFGGDFAGIGFPLGLLFYGISITGCHILPEILFTCLCKAILVRFGKLAELTRGLQSGQDGDPDVTERLGQCREVYRLLMEAIGHTSTILGGILVTTCCMNPLFLSATVYIMVRESLPNFGITVLKISMFLTASSRILAVCFFGNAVESQIFKFKRILYQTHTLAFSNESINELELFMRCVKMSHPKFTAGGFITVNKEFMAKVAGTILTYTLTLLQFDQEESLEMKLEQNGCHNY